MSGELSSSYSVLKLHLRGSSDQTRYLYLKPHTGSDALPTDRAIFVAGLPAQLGESSLLALFSRFGAVERVAVHPSRSGAVVLYEEAAGSAQAIKSARAGKAVRVDVAEPQAPFGLKGARRPRKRGRLCTGIALHASTPTPPTPPAHGTLRGTAPSRCRPVCAHPQAGWRPTRP